MPNYAPNVYATWVFTPTPDATASVSIFNNGTHTAYVGRSGVNQADGMPVQPGNRPVKIQNITYPLYACSDVSIGAVAGSIGTNYTAGTSQFTTSASVSTSVGSVLVIGNTANTGWEAVVVSSVSTSGTTVATAAPFVSDHVGSQPIYVGTALGASIYVTPGVL